MYTLFDLQDQDTNVSFDQHGLRLGTFFLTYFGEFEDYITLRKPSNIFAKMQRAHDRARKCPMRGTSLQGKGFTYNQVYTWVGYLYTSCEEKGVGAE